MIDEREMARALEILRGGGVLAYPTETFYGLGADATSPAAVDRVFAIKGRERGKPLPLIVAGRAMLDRVVRRVPPAAERLMEKYWPGALTLVLEAAPGLPAEVTGGTGRVGVRVSSHPVAARLVRELDRPLTATSANRSGEASPATAEEVARSLGHDVDLILDGGKLPGRLGSTVVDLTGETRRILRAGDLAVELKLGLDPVE